MSKKAVSRALKALDAGAESAKIDEILHDGGVTETFLRRRLRHLIDSGDSDSAPAQRLWTAKFGDSLDVQSTRDTKARDPAPESLDSESPPAAIRLDDPTPLLSWVERNRSGVFSLTTLKMFEVWGVVATATLARSESSGPLTLAGYDQSDAGRFARAIGSMDLMSLLKCVWVAAAPVLCLHSRGTASRSTRRASGSHRRDARSPAACC